MREFELEQEVPTEYGKQWPHVDVPRAVGHTAADVEQLPDAAMCSDPTVRRFVSADGSSYTVLGGEPPMMEPMYLGDPDRDADD